MAGANVKHLAKTFKGSLPPLESVWMFICQKMKETINLANHLVSSAMDKVKESPFAMKIVGFMEDGVNATLPYVKKYGGYAVDKIKQHPYLSGFIVVFAFVLWKCRCRCTRGKMMKAPGKGYMMLRGDFEKDPRSYFLDLRGKSGGTGFDEC